MRPGFKYTGKFKGSAQKQDDRSSDTAVLTKARDLRLGHIYKGIRMVTQGGMVACKRVGNEGGSIHASLRGTFTDYEFAKRAIRVAYEAAPWEYEDFEPEEDPMFPKLDTRIKHEGFFIQRVEGDNTSWEIQNEDGSRAHQFNGVFTTVETASDLITNFNKARQRRN